MMQKERAVCLNCIDGRTQIPVIHWIKDNYNAGYVDMITEPGMDGHLADANNTIEDINRKLRISIEKNHASMIFVVGHYDCKGNPVSDSLHKTHIQSAVTRLKKEFSGADILGLWVNEEWKVDVL